MSHVPCCNHLVWVQLQLSLLCNHDKQSAELTDEIHGHEIECTKSGVHAQGWILAWPS